MHQSTPKCPLRVIYLHILLLWSVFSGVSSFISKTHQNNCPFLHSSSIIKRQLFNIGTSLSDGMEASGISHSLENMESNSNFKMRNRRVAALRMSSNNEVDNWKRKPNDEKLNVFVLGLSHHNANIELREKLAVPEEEWNIVAQELCQFDSIQEAAILSTCNRFEVYIAGTNMHEAIHDALLYLHSRIHQHVHTLQAMDAGVSLSVSAVDGNGVTRGDHPEGKELTLDQLQDNMFILDGEDAVAHIMKVTAGLDSLVIGEGQILCQVKKAHDKAGEGYGGKIVNRLLNSAVTAGKRVRAETNITRGAVSVSSAAGEFSCLQLKEFTENRIQIHNSNIVILGAGKMSKLLLTHLQSLGVTKAVIVNRSEQRVDELRLSYPNMTLSYMSLDKMWEAIQEADLVFPSTKSNITLVNPDPLASCLQVRHKKTPLMFMDISVPRNVHPDCSSVSDRVKCYNVDDLKAVVNRNTMKRRDAVVEAEKIISDETGKFMSWQAGLDAVPTISKLQERAEHYRQEEMSKATKKLSENITEKDLDVLDRLSKGLVAKLIHGPMLHLRRQQGEDTSVAVSQLQQAFQL